MSKAAVVIENWKLPIFKRHLDKAGFKFTEHPGLTDDVMVLKVEYNFVADLQPVVEAAVKECKRSSCN